MRASSREETRERRAPCRASAIQHGGALLKATGSRGGAPNQGVAPSHFSVLKSHLRTHLEKETKNWKPSFNCLSQKRLVSYPVH